jgi:hypothetical protein
MLDGKASMGYIHHRRLAVAPWEGAGWFGRNPGFAMGKLRTQNWKIGAER